ncbi:unnamed protein product [Parnassius mnemosyne]|uniref:Uncharacterized protein n=1 Tax=Parnassius mnemosyne TaxID=213953 RepID=A0AAV1M360_9NEOP
MPKRSADEKIGLYLKKIQRLTDEKSVVRRRWRVRVISSDSSEANEGCGETTQRIATAEVHRPPSGKIDPSWNDAAGASPEAEIARDIEAETPRDNEAASLCDNAELMAEIPISMPEHPLPMPAAEPNEAGQSLEALSYELELDPDLLEALGEPTDAAPEFGPKIYDSLAKLWLPLLTKGMTKENKDKIMKQYLIPDNCRFLQAPKINGEIFSAIPEVVRNRDKGLSFHQQKLGCGITAINRALDLLLRGDNKKEAIQHLSNGCRILSDQDTGYRKGRNLVW